MLSRTVCCVCSSHFAVFFRIVDIQHMHPMPVLIHHLREIQAMCSQNCVTADTSANRDAVKGVDYNAMLLYYIFPTGAAYARQQPRYNWKEKKTKDQRKKENSTKRKRKRKRTKNAYAPKNSTNSKGRPKRVRENCADSETT